MSSWLDLCGDDSNLSMASADFDRELKHLSSLSRLSATATRSRSKFDIEFDNSQAGVNLLFKKNVQILDENSKSRKRKIYSINEINEINEINNDNINLPPKAKQRTNIAGDWKQTKICNKNNKNDFSHFLKWVKNEKTNKNINCNINSNTNSNNNILRTKSFNNKNNKNNKFFVISNASSSNKLKSRRIRRKNKKIQKIQINNNDNDNDNDDDIDIDMKENIQNNKENICINQDKKEDIQIQIQIETNSNSSNDLDLDLIKDKDRVPEPEQVQDKPTEPEPNAVPDAIAVADVDQDEDEDEDLKPTKANDPAPAPVPVLDANPNPDNDLKKNTPQHQDPDPIPIPIPVPVIDQDKAVDVDQDENKDPDSISGSGCGSVAGSVTVSVSNSDVDISSQTSSRRSSIKIRRRITPVLSNIIFNSDLMQMKVPILKKQNNNNDKCGAPVFLNADQYIKLTGNTPKKIENKPIKKQNIIINNQQINHKNNITQQIKNDIADEIKDEIEDSVSDDIDIDIIASKSASTSKSTFQSVWGSNSLIDPHSKENKSGNSSWAQKLFSSEIAQNKLKKESESEMLVNIKKTARINDIQIDSILPSVSILSRESSTSIISSSNTNRSSATGVLIDGPPRNQIEWRRKQILIGKSTEGYNNCLNKYPNYNDNNYYKYNNNKLILTPSPQEKIGKKRWIGKLLKWRKFLHQFDNNNNNNNEHNTSNNDNQ